MSYMNREALEELYANQGLSTTEIAKMFGVNQGTIWYKVHLLKFFRAAVFPADMSSLLAIVIVSPSSFGALVDKATSRFGGLSGVVRSLSVPTEARAFFKSSTSASSVEKSLLSVPFKASLS